jgi:NADH-quinone oxidoreductase subunit L
VDEFIGSMVAGEGAEVAGHSLVPLFTSLLVSLGGLALGYLVYRGFTSATQTDPTQKAVGGWYWKTLQNRYGIDTFYNNVFVAASHWVSEVFTYRWVDKKVIDGFLEGVARGSLSIGAAIRRWFDLAVVNRLGDLSGKGVRVVGSDLREVQTGHIQQYMLMALIVLLVVGAVFFFMVLA